MENSLCENIVFFGCMLLLLASVIPFMLPEKVKFQDVDRERERRNRQSRYYG